MIIFKIAGMGLTVSILNIILKKCGRDAEAFFEAVQTLFVF